MAPVITVVAAVAKAAPAVAGAMIANKYASDQQAKSQEDAQKKTEKKQKALVEQQAGEYQAQTVTQMKMNALQSQTQTLAEILENQGAPEPRVFTLPPNQSTNPLDRINQAIDEWIKGVN